MIACPELSRGPFAGRGAAGVAKILEAGLGRKAVTRGELLLASSLAASARILRRGSLCLGVGRPGVHIATSCAQVEADRCAWKRVTCLR
jgi:hypothetical protein